MGSSIKFSEEEQDLFCNDSISPYAKILYFNLRRRMDFETGVVGMSPNHIRYSWLAHDIDYKPPAGSKELSRVHKRSMVIHLLSVLKKLGYLTPVETDGKVLDLVFKLPKAQCASIRSQEQQQGNNTPATAISTTTAITTSQTRVVEKKSNKNNVVSASGVVSNNISNNTSSNIGTTPQLQHISGNPVNNISIQGWITENWRPSQMVIDWCRQFKPVTDELFELVLHGYVCFWLSEEGVKKGKPKKTWDIHFKSNYSFLLAHEEQRINQYIQQVGVTSENGRGNTGNNIDFDSDFIDDDFRAKVQRRFGDAVSEQDS